MTESLEQRLDEAKMRIFAVENLNDLEKIRLEFLGKKGFVNDLVGELKSAPKEKRAELGKKINDFRKQIEKFLAGKKKIVRKMQIQESMKQEAIDVTLLKERPNLGNLHPITIVQQRLEDLFMQMGFEVLDGPHIETEFYNFTALNIPEYHPARDMQDTFYFENKMLLRTQTSPIQIRGMEASNPPLRIVGPGKVFRAERVDASHECVFHQIEGMVIDRGISVANLVYFMNAIINKIFERETKVRLRPGYFPFVEPGFELDIRCQICGGSGCSVCKKVGWIELLGCGMVHPKVLKNGNIDPDEYSGFAFGMGLDRLVMSKYGIDDIRNLHSGGLEFSRQFSKVS